MWRTIQYAQVDGGELRAAEQPRHTAELRDAVRTRRFPSCSTTPPRTESCVGTGLVDGVAPVGG